MPSEAARPAEPKAASTAAVGIEAPSDESSYDYESSEEPEQSVVVVRRYQKPQAEEELVGQTPAPTEADLPKMGDREDLKQAEEAAKEVASGSTQPMQLEPKASSAPTEPRSAAKPKTKKTPFYKAKAPAPTKDEKPETRPRVVLTEGLGASRPGHQDQEE